MPELFSKKSNRKKLWNIWIVLVLFLMLLAGISVGVYLLYPSMAENEDMGCSTESCLESALEIMSSLDPTVHPCEDFYQFACGNFMNKADEGNTPSPYFAQNIKNINKLNAIITEPIRGDEVKAALLQKTFYQACMNLEKINEDEDKTFKELLEELGGWPVIGGHTWMDENFHLDEIITKCKNLGLPFQWFFQFSFDEDFYEIHINVPKTIQENDFSKDLIYLYLMVETVVQLGGSRTTATEEMMKVITFERRLENVILRNNQNAIAPVNVSALDSVFPRFSWLQFIDTFMEDFNYTQTENYLISTDETYLRELNSLLARTPNRTQVNYIIWKVVQEFGLYLSTPIRENFANYRNYIMLPEKSRLHQTTRVECCAEESRIRFPGVVETEFIYRYIDEDKYQNIMKMLTDIKDQFIKRLRSASWIDIRTKEVVINKAKNIVQVIGLEALRFNEDIFDIDVNDLEFTTENIINMIREKNINDFKRLFLPTSTSLSTNISNPVWTFDIYAAYMSMPNILFLSAGIVQDTFYNVNRPNFLNYGALGSIIGSKISQGFTKYAYDLMSEKNIITALYNESMYRIITESWNKDSSNVTDFSQHEEMETKFENEILDQKLNMENFIDYIGLDIAYAAYNKWVNENYEERKLLHLPYTPLQMFWLEFGRINCYKEMEGVKLPIIEDTPISTRYKVINSVLYSKNFAKDFKCHEGTPMNPYVF